MDGFRKGWGEWFGRLNVARMALVRGLAEHVVDRMLIVVKSAVYVKKRSKMRIS